MLASKLMVFRGFRDTLHISASAEDYGYREESRSIRSNVFHEVRRAEAALRPKAGIAALDELTSRAGWTTEFHTIDETIFTSTSYAESRSTGWFEQLDLWNRRKTSIRGLRHSRHSVWHVRISPKQSRRRIRTARGTGHRSHRSGGYR